MPGSASDIVMLENDRMLNLLSLYLNDAPRSLGAEDIEPLLEFGITKEEAFSMALAGLLGLDIADNPADAEFYAHYFPQMIHQLDANEFRSDPYFSNIALPQVERGTGRFEMLRLEPYEGVVCDDMIRTDEGRVIAQIGFFDEPFEFPGVLENGRIWMTLAPNEIASQRSAIEHARGRVVTFGLGLGYYAYMAARKPEVESVTVVEISRDIIALFEEHILPQFEQREKIHVICADAFEFAEHELPKLGADLAYTDLWHDVGDGIDLYLRMKELERFSPNTEFAYWIEPTMLCYL